MTPWDPLTAGQVNGLDSAAINQTLFGVAVNLNLRNALQQAQGLAVGSEAAADQPTMPRAFYAGTVSGFVKGGSANATWKTLTGIAGDESKQVNICRRANGSGTQASSNLFFLEAATIAKDEDGMLAPLTAQLSRSRPKPVVRAVRPADGECVPDGLQSVRAERPRPQAGVGDPPRPAPRGTRCLTRTRPGSTSGSAGPAAGRGNWWPPSRRSGTR